MDAGLWTWLEVAKLVASLLVPLALAGLGIFIHRTTKKFEHLQWRSQKLIEKRLAIYDELAPHFNDLLCYFTYIGAWRDFNPPDVASSKRVIDRKVHLAAPMFSEKFYLSCSEFLSLCFETYVHWGADPRLRTAFERRSQVRGEDWQADWGDCFSHEVADPESIQISYRKLMAVFAEEIGVHPQFAVPESSKIPSNIA